LQFVRRHIAVIGMVAGLLVSGCGGGSSSGVSADSYVKAVCTAMRNWAQEIEAGSGTLNLATITNAKQGKTAIQRFFAGAVADTRTATSKLKSAGTPAVTGGFEISSALASSFAQIEAALTRGQRQANALPADDPAAFPTAGRALGGEVQRALTNIGSGLSGLRSPELEKAAQNEPACALTRG
jgi:hypothetical protein